MNSFDVQLHCEDTSWVEWCEYFDIRQSDPNLDEPPFEMEG